VRLGEQHWWWRFNAPLLAAEFATLLCVLLSLGHQKQWWTLPLHDRMELTSVDARFKLRGERKPKTDDIVILGLDERARTEANEIFQLRRGWATLIDELTQYKPLAVGIDMFFSAPELALDPSVVAKLRKARVGLAAQTTPERTPAITEALSAFDAVLVQTKGDEQLAAAIARSKRVHLAMLPYWPKLVNGEKAAKPGSREPPEIKLARYGEAVATPGPSSQRPPGAIAMGYSMNMFTKVAAGSGSVAVVVDSDGRVRRVYTVVDHAGRYYMPLGMSLALLKLGAGADASYAAGQSHVRAGDKKLPVDKRGIATLSYLGPTETFPHVSVADVFKAKKLREQARTAADKDKGALLKQADELQERLRKRLGGKLVFIGYTDIARDKVGTPFDTHLPGVEIHATLAHNILHGELMRRSSPMTTLLLIFFLGSLLAMFQLRPIRQRRGWITGAAVVFVVFWFWFAAQMLFNRGLIIEVVAPTVSCVFVTIAALTALLATEGREKSQLKTAFSQYVNDTVVNTILADPSATQLGGRRRDLTVLFSDIRGFSKFSEQLEPEALSDYLNEYLTPMTDLVFADGGMLDKYIGDAVMAVYGAPVDMNDHAKRACRTALAMMAALGPLNKHWRDRDLPEIAIGVGINSGPMSVGNMGSDARFDYTVMGDAVNLGARLEGLTKEYKVQILAGPKTVEAAKDDFVFRELDLVRVKGREGSAQIYELIGPVKSARMSEGDLALYDDALAAYRERDWPKATEKFEGFLARFPDDGPAAVMLARVTNLTEAPPAEDWDGVYEQLFK